MSQLYFMELFVDDLNLDDQIVKDSGDTLFVIKLSVIDLPTFEITRQNLLTAKVGPPRNQSHLDFRAGQACHFTMTPEKLAKKVLKHPFSVKIFRQGDSIPMCLAELPLSGCFCDQAKRSVDDSHLPKPFVFGGTIALVDIGGNPSGSVYLTLRLTCQGGHVITSYVLDKECFLFKNDPQGSEFRVEEMPKGDKKNDDRRKVEEMWQLPWENFMRDVAGIFPCAGRLSLGKPPPRALLAPLVPPDLETPLDGKKKGKDKTKTKKKK